jgi:hypothetical protein
MLFLNFFFFFFEFLFRIEFFTFLSTQFPPFYLNAPFL